MVRNTQGVDTAIVTDVEGTTRDVLREEITIDGVPLHVVDTAGLRTTEDQVELEGIRRARAQMDNADHVPVVIDATRPALPDIELPESVRRTIITNKCDQVDDATLRSVKTQFSASLCISAKHGEGLEALKSYPLKLAGHDSAIEGVSSARRRHLDALYHAREATDAALYRLRESSMPELAAEELCLAQQSLDLITGRFDSEDLLGGEYFPISVSASKVLQALRNVPFRRYAAVCVCILVRREPQLIKNFTLRKQQLLPEYRYFSGDIVTRMSVTQHKA